jgi:hypothetical protein
MIRTLFNRIFQTTPRERLLNHIRVEIEYIASEANYRKALERIADFNAAYPGDAEGLALVDYAKDWWQAYQDDCRIARKVGFLNSFKVQ